MLLRGPKGAESPPRTARSGSFIYALGGVNGGAGFKAAEGYAPQLNAWGGVALLPRGRLGFSAITGPGGKIFLIGGCGTTIFPPGCAGSALRTVDVYTPSSNTYSTRAPLPVARVANGAALGSDGRLYALGGRNGSGLVSEVDAYSFTSHSWTQVAPLPKPREAAVVVAGKDGRIYVIGGIGSGTTAAVSNQAYNLATNTWTSRAPLPFGVSMAAGAVGPDGRIYVVGGCNTSLAPNCLYTGTGLQALDEHLVAGERTVRRRRQRCSGDRGDGFLYLVGGTYDLSG